MIEWLKEAVHIKASDLHTSVGSPAVYRVNGELTSLGEPLTPAQIQAFAKAMMTEDQWQRYENTGEVDFSYSIAGTARFRVNVYKQRGCTSVAVRVVPNHVPALDQLGLPPALADLTVHDHGLVLVTGPTGSGKSTTLAALIDHINTTRKQHIITLEDPIEYLHKHQLSLIDQREIGMDTLGFGPALRAALRQDPDVILVGEMRDLETMSTAMTAAETGHLVFATMHTSDAVQTIERVIDVFPGGQQAQIRVQLASVLQGVVAQKLIKSLDASGRVAAVEILLNTPAVANLIRSDKVHQIRSVLQTGRSQGMQTMEMHLQELITQGKISKSAVAQHASRN